MTECQPELRRRGIFIHEAEEEDDNSSQEKQHSGESAPSQVFSSLKLNTVCFATAVLPAAARTVPLSIGPHSVLVASYSTHLTFCPFMVFVFNRSSLHILNFDSLKAEIHSNVVRQSFDVACWRSPTL